MTLADAIEIGTKGAVTYLDARDDRGGDLAFRWSSSQVMSLYSDACEVLAEWAISVLGEKDAFNA